MSTFDALKAFRNAAISAFFSARSKPSGYISLRDTVQDTQGSLGICYYTDFRRIVSPDFLRFDVDVNDLWSLPLAPMLKV